MNTTLVSAFDLFTETTPIKTVHHPCYHYNPLVVLRNNRILLTPHSLVGSLCFSFFQFIPLHSNWINSYPNQIKIPNQISFVTRCNQWQCPPLTFSFFYFTHTRRAAREIGRKVIPTATTTTTAATRTAVLYVHYPEHHGNRCRTNQHRPMLLMMAIETTTTPEEVRRRDEKTSSVEWICVHNQIKYISTTFNRYWNPSSN